MLGPIGMQELILLLIVILLLFGAKKIPQLARNLGRAKGEFTKAKDKIAVEIQSGESEIAS